MSFQIAVASLVAAAAFAAAPPTRAADAERTPFTDAEIVGAVSTGNQGELDAAALVSSRTTNAAVSAFAASMLKDHGKAKDGLGAVAAKTGLTPAGSGLREALEKSGADLIAKLTPLSGDPFDRAYIDAAVADHAALLKKLDAELIPDSKTPELTTFLRRLRPMVAHHLAAARRAQAKVETPAK